MIHYPSQPNIEDGTPEIEVTQPNNEVSIDNYFDSSFQNSFEAENAEAVPAGKRKMKASLLREREASAPNFMSPHQVKEIVREVCSNRIFYFLSRLCLEPHVLCFGLVCFGGGDQVPCFSGS